MIADVGLRGVNPSDTGRGTPAFVPAAAQRLAAVTAPFFASLSPLAFQSRDLERAK
jgi:hypothetical protein